MEREFFLKPKQNTPKFKNNSATKLKAAQNNQYTKKPNNKETLCCNVIILLGNIKKQKPI